MSVAEKVVERLSALPPDKQQEVLEFVESLSEEAGPNSPLFNPEGLWAGRGCDIAPEELAEARRDMWSRFYDEDVP
jgi:hypothetical protein